MTPKWPQSEEEETAYSDENTSIIFIDYQYVFRSFLTAEVKEKHKESPWLLFLQLYLAINANFLVWLPILESFIYIAKLNNCSQEVFFYSTNQDYDYLNHIQIKLLILYPYMGVPQTVHNYKSGSLSD